MTQLSRSPQVNYRIRYSKKKFSREEDAEIERLRVEGWSIGRIAKKLGRARSSIQDRLVRLAKKQENDDGPET